MIPAGVFVVLGTILGAAFLFLIVSAALYALGVVQ